MSTSMPIPFPAQFAESLPIEDLARTIATELKVKPSQVMQTLTLLDDGNTIPFIARYRKEATGSLDEVQIQDVEDRSSTLRSLHERKGDILRIIHEQGKLSAELAQAIIAATTLQSAEDLYLPYRPKRKTRASIAREKGLEPLAQQILAQVSIQGISTAQARIAAATPYLSEEKGVLSLEDAYTGARDICAEVIAEDARVRAALRQQFMTTSALRTRLTVSAEEIAQKDPRGVYTLYYDFTEHVTRLTPHRVLAINRAEREDVIRVAAEVPLDQAVEHLHTYFPISASSPFAEDIAVACADSVKRLLAPSLEREVRAMLTEKAEAHAIGIFATNVRNLLLQPPLRGNRIMGIDPGFRTGCKISVIDENGTYCEGATIYPHAPKNQGMQAKQILRALCVKHTISAIAIGNGTASRETEQFIAELIQDLEQEHAALIPGFTIVSEAGASVYSASAIARQEFPDLDVTERGGISIARRLQDPLAELVKIDPKAIGVGLYQHDVDQRELAKELERVVTSCVNYAGVDVNAASAELLKHVSGINARVAESIVQHRMKNGSFTSRKGVLKVSGLGPATFVQAAGFLRVPNGKELLDNTFIHPESYDAVHALLTLLPGDTQTKLPERVQLWRSMSQLQTKQKNTDAMSELATRIGVGVPTLADILTNLEKPGIDPREDLPPVVLRHDVLSMDDLQEGMQLQGTVRNVVDFGAFVDIGVKHDGLVHVSEMADRFINDPTAVVAVGQVVTVRVVSIDKARGRIQLSMRTQAQR